MPRIELTTLIHAPVEIVFDLARSIDAHQASQSARGERAVAGRTTGLIGAGEEVTWEAVHFGIRQRLCSRIVSMSRPDRFRDSMVTGAFKRFDHDHFFASSSSGVTTMKDVFDYESPLGILGRIADGLFLNGYMTRLLSGRNSILKKIAESADHEKFLTPYVPPAPREIHP